MPMIHTAYMIDQGYDAVSAINHNHAICTNFILNWRNHSGKTVIKQHFSLHFHQVRMTLNIIGIIWLFCWADLTIEWLDSYISLWVVATMTFTPVILSNTVIWTVSRHGYLILFLPLSRLSPVKKNKMIIFKYTVLAAFIIMPSRGSLKMVVSNYL